MSDLTDFLLARIAEDEARAQAATAGRWQWADDPEDGLDAGDEPVIWASGMHTEGYVRVKPEDADHIARWDPSRVLAECDAKRQVVTVHYFMPGHDSRDFGFSDGNCVTCRTQGPCVTLRHLALPYADHPDYQQEWRP